MTHISVFCFTKDYDKYMAEAQIGKLDISANLCPVTCSHCLAAFYPLSIFPKTCVQLDTRYRRNQVALKANDILNCGFPGKQMRTAVQLSSLQVKIIVLIAKQIECV